MTNEDVQARTDFLLYESADGSIHVDVLFESKTVWLTQKKMGELFGVNVRTISEHLKNIFDSGELEADSVIRKFRNTAEDGKSYRTQFYNLDAIISVGYRVNSIQATQFRIWATETLRSYILKGFAIDDERLKNGSRFSEDYFDELLERIREIRASERRFYQKITDIYATAIDYSRDSKIAKKFYATVQNKLHVAIHGRTAAELIADRANADKPNMGLTTWKNSPDGKILKSDVVVGKNYLDDKQISELNRVVTMYLDYAENQAQRRVPMQMSDWVEKLDAFLQFNEYEILDNPGKLSAVAAAALAEEEFSKFRVAQDQNFESDFDKEVKRLNVKDD